MEFNFAAQQGWQCPICKRVYSPLTPMCLYCGQVTVTSSDTLTVTYGNQNYTEAESRRMYKLFDWKDEKDD